MSGFPETMTVKACAREVGVSRMTIYRLVHDGTIPAMRIGRSIRIRRADWEMYLHRARVL